MSTQKKAELPTFDIRYSEEKDQKHLEQWLAFPHVLDCFPMATQQETHLMVRNWMSFCRYRSSLTAVFREKPIGIATIFLMPYRKVAHHGMLYFMVSPKFQREGVGAALIKNIKHLGKQAFHLEGLHLDIYEGCAALPFLKSQGFHEVLRQEKFVKENGKYRSRILMEAKL